jgi:hypothetical protein
MARATCVLAQRSDYISGFDGRQQQIVGGIGAQVCVIWLRQSSYFSCNYDAGLGNPAQCGGADCPLVTCHMCCECSCILLHCFDLYRPQFFSFAKKYFLQDWLLKEAQISQPDFMRRLQEVAPTVPRKAWRFAVMTAVCLLRLVFTLAAKKPLQTRLITSRILKMLQAAQSPWWS